MNYRRNGKIELMRFVFCLTVLFRHINHDLWKTKKILIGKFTFFKYGYMGVEFFFLVSGYLMASTISRKIEKERLDSTEKSTDLGIETIQFLGHKIKGILPYHIISCVLMIAICLLKNPGAYLRTLFNALPSLLFLQRLGLGDGQVLNVEWYIGSMLLAMLLLYPICRRYYSVFSRVAAPIISLLLIGYLIHETGGMGGSGVWLGWTYKCNIRAVAEICLGIVCYELCNQISSIKFTFPARVMFSLVECACYAMPILYMCSPLNQKYESYVVALLAIAITLSFGRIGVLGERGVFQNRVCMFLGAISLPVYLIQNVTRILVIDLCGFLSTGAQAFVITVATVLAGAIMYCIVGRRNRAGQKQMAEKVK